jgi:hypothetical protein
MSYSLKVADGDLVQQGSQLALVFGVDKLNQDIMLWLMERYGGDRFHVSMGSILEEFVGAIATPSTRSEVQAEVFRVLQNYQAVQLRRMKENPQLLSSSELLVSVDDIATTMSYDTVSVMCRLRNGSDTSTTIKVAQTV